MRSRLRLDDLLLLIAAVALTALYALAAGGNFPLDDSWIHQTYARNLAETGQWAFVPGEPSAASTSPLYTVVLAVGYWLNLPFRLWAHGIGAVTLGLTGMLARRLVERFAPSFKGIGMVAGLAVIGAWHLLWAAASGMETPIFAMFTLLVVWLGVQQSNPSPNSERGDKQAVVLPSPRLRARGVGGEGYLSAVIFGVAAGLTTLTRAEGALLVGLVGAALLIARPSRRTFVWGVIAAAVFIVVLAPYLAFNYSVTGGVLPNTAAAKRMDATPLFYESVPWRIGYLLTPLAAGGQLLLVPGMIAYTLGVTRRLRGDRRWWLALVPVAWGVGLILLYALWLPLNIQHSRYLIPALPALILAGVIGTAWLIRAASGSLIGRVLTRVLALSALLIFVGFAFGLGLQQHVIDVRIIDEEMVAAARYLAANVPPEETLAVHDIGAVGYFAPRPIIDIAGLVTPETIPLAFDDAGLWSFLRERGARYIMGLENQIPRLTANAPALCLEFTTNAQTAINAGGSNMSVFRLAWDATCPPD